MKKLLAGGMERIWQLAPVFRDGERGATHHPEFAMLEWYRAGATYRDLMADCETLLRAAQAAAGATELFRGGKTADARLPFERLSVADAFSRYANIDILATAPDPMEPDFALLAAAAERIGIAPHPGDDWEALYFRIFLDRIEPHLGIGAPTILYDYPVSMAALSRRKPDDPRLAERFELYVCGLELANAFQELTDPQSSAPASLPTRRANRRSTARPTRSTRIFSPRSSTGCRNAPGSPSASTGWSCCAPAPPTSKTCCGHR